MHVLGVVELTAHVLAQLEARKKKTGLARENGDGSSVVDAVNFDTKACFHFS